MKKIDSKDIKAGDKVWVEVDITNVNPVYDCGWHYGDEVFGKPLNNLVYKEDGWIEYKWEEFYHLRSDILVLVNFNSWSGQTSMEVNSREYFSDQIKSSDKCGDIIAYKVITPYTHPRKKVVVNNSVELHQLIIDNGKVYYDLNSKFYVTFLKSSQTFQCYKPVGDDHNIETKVCDFDDWNKVEWWVK